jgi:Domain of unknown function (DUF4115)
MGGVEVAVAVGAGIVVVGIISAMVRRRGSREAQSVAGYRQTLDVLGHLGGAERGLGGHGTGAGDAPRTGLPDEPTAGGPSRFDDLGARAGGRGPGEVPPRRDRSLLAMERPARRLGLPVAALLLVLAAGGAAAYMVVRSHHATPPPKKPARSHSHGHTTPTTTLPPRYTATTSTTTSATYVPTSSTYSLTIGATTSDCWMSVTSSSGTTVLAQTFAAGATASVPLTGHSTIVIGAPRSAEMSIGGVPVVLPSGIAGPFTVTLVPS